jgi:glycosyltransferase involved in cell wall biosynthesis
MNISIVAPSFDTPIDVLVCSHDDARFLAAMFDGFLRQTAGRDAFRILFVDNASTDATREIVASYSDRLAILYLEEPRLGKNIALNTGYRDARSRFVAHIDSDAQPEPQWIERILKVTDAVNPDICGGGYRPLYVAGRPDWYLDRFGSFDLGPEPRLLGSREYFGGANMVWRRELVLDLGGFDETIGPRGRAGTARGGETELFVRARRRNPRVAVYYDPTIAVRHTVRAEWCDPRYLMRRGFTSGVVAVVSGRRGGFVDIFRTVASVALDLGREALGASLWRNRRRYPYWMSYWYERMLPMVFKLGVLAGTFRRRNPQASNV